VLPFGGIGNRLIVGLDAGKESDDFKRTRFCNLDSPGDPNANASSTQGVPSCRAAAALSPSGEAPR
jgi:hypothetical protein